jgi:hypothetical protein
MIFPTWFYFLLDEVFNWQVQLGPFYLWMKPTSLPLPWGSTPSLGIHGINSHQQTNGWVFRLMDEIFQLGCIVDECRLPTRLYCGWTDCQLGCIVDERTANSVVLWMNRLPTWFYSMCHFYYFELWIGEGYVFKPVLTSYWKRTRLSIKVQIRVSENLPIDFTFFYIPDPEPTWPGMSVLDIPW